MTTRLSLVFAVLIAVGCTSDSADSHVVQAAAPAYSAEQRASTELVMKNARDICAIRVEDPHLVVECKADISHENQLAFARAIADADVVLNGSPRNIYFYLPGGAQFAQADPVNGIRLK